MLSLRKVITVLIVNITGRSGSEVRNTVNSLVDLLNGRTVRVGTESISTQNNQEASKFALDLIAKKIMVSWT